MPYICSQDCNNMEKFSVKTRVIGVDLSVNETNVAIVNLRGDIIARTNFSNSSYADPNDYVARLSEEIVQIAEANGGMEEIRSVGVSSPSANSMTGCIENAVNLPWKGSVPMAAMLCDRIGLAVALCNDGQCIMMGEQAFGCARGMSNFMVITLGHGVGSTIYTNGGIVKGEHGFGGEFGHTCIVPNGRKCNCGHDGCLEAYVGAKGIMKTAKEIMEQSSEPSLMRDEKTLTPKLIADLCDKGDPLAIEVYRRTGVILGISLANYASVLDPEAIILAGGIAEAGKWLFNPIYDAFEEHVFHNIRGKVKIVRSMLNTHERDVLGASAFAWSVKEYSLFK